ncbi:MAG: DUF4382 domain-containing protein [Pseudomonadales bacterium]
MTIPITRTVVGTLAVTLLSACGGGSGGNGDGPATGSLSLGLVDAPVDEVFEVNVQITGVSVKPQSGPAQDFMFTSPQDVDVLALQNGTVFDLLVDETVPAGRYNWIEVHANAEFDGVFDSYALETALGGMIELRIPSGSARFVSGFVVTAGQNNAFMLDWDLRRALTDPVGQNGWQLTPAHRLIDITEYGSLSGTVADGLTMDNACTSDAEGNGNLVYLFVGENATPDDLGSAGEPVTTAPVRVNDAMAGAYSYTFEFLDPGAYTVAFTCQGLDDVPDSDEAGVDEIVFLGQVNAAVDAGQGTRNEAPPIE